VSIGFRLAANDQPGTWEIRAQDFPAGLAREATFEVAAQ